MKKKAEATNETEAFISISNHIGRSYAEELAGCADSRGRISIPKTFQYGEMSTILGKDRMKTLVELYGGQRLKITNKKIQYIELIIKACVEGRVPKYVMEETLNITRGEINEITKKVLPTHPS
jgi:hypothetical protein